MVSDGSKHIKNYNTLFKNIKNEENKAEGLNVEKEVKSDDD